MSSAPSLWAITRRSLVKDLRLEWRSKDAINSMLFFALLVVVIFSFGFDPNRRGVAQNCRRLALGCDSVCHCRGSQPDLDARTA